MGNRSIAFVETVDDNQPSRSRCIEISCLQQLAKRIDNERNDLGFKGSSEDKKVPLNGSDDLPPCLREIYCYLIGDCCDEGFRIITCGI